MIDTSREQLKTIFEHLITAYLKEISEFCPYIGAFIFDHNSKSVIIDKNCMNMLNLDENYSYESVSSRMDSIKENLISDLDMKILFDTPILTLGVIKSIYMTSSSPELSDDSTNPVILERFNRLISENLFQYHFQPIIDAHTGEIFAYEALMRTDSDIALYPLEILELAKRYNKLYDIELATMNNTIEYLKKHKNEFNGRKLFVNAITAYILKDEDWANLEEKYRDVLGDVVIEFTEQSEIADEELKHIRTRIKRCNMHLAIDDYGTGYSNTTNLLRYKPRYVKLDRALISEIDTKQNMQKLVSSLIEFLHINGIMALAEGVETLDELTTVIRMGADLIQGYYVSKPKPFVMSEIADSTKKEINQINITYSSDIAKVYHTTDNEIIDLHKLATSRYNVVFLESSNVTIIGNPEESFNILFVTKDDTEVYMTWKDVHITSDKDDPIIALGNNSILHFNLINKNEMLGKGIYVPQTSYLDIIGEGDLHILAEKTDCYAIGADKNHSHGTINIALTGSLTIDSNGDDVVAIGGGKNIYGNIISIKSGMIEINASGNNCLGIGTISGNSNIDISACYLKIDISSSNCVGIGSLSGSVSVDISRFRIEISLSGINLCGIGVPKEGVGFISGRDGGLYITNRGRNITGVGTNSGDIRTDFRNTRIKVHCEGNYATGIGDMDGAGAVRLIKCESDIYISSKVGYGIGSPNGELYLEDCDDSTRVNVE